MPVREKLALAEEQRGANIGALVGGAAAQIREKKLYQQLKDVRQELTGEGGLFQVNEVEVRGQMLKTFAMAPASLRDVWLMTAGFAERDYLLYEDERWTYAQAMAETASIANWVMAQGVKRGDRVAISMRNYPEWMLCCLLYTSPSPRDGLLSRMPSSA